MQGETPGPAPEVTDLLQAWGGGDQVALHKLIPLVYRDLRRVARRTMRGERPDHTLQTTALVHEVYLKLMGSKPPQWESRAHFIAIATKLMRQILVDHARTKHYRKRGGGATRVTLDDALAFPAIPAPDLAMLDDALSALSQFDERKGKVVELRFFGGLSVDETAHVLKVSPQTVMRDWRLAKVWLYRELQRGERVDSPIAAHDAARLVDRDGELRHAAPEL